MRRRCPPGSHPDTFGERLRGRGTPGACGQFTLYDLRGDSVGAPGVADRMGWPVDDLGVAVFDWADGDAAAPFRGPAWPAGGAPTAGGPTPWRSRAMADVTSTRYLLADSRASAAGALASPADNEDVVHAALIRVLGDFGAVAYALGHLNAGLTRGYALTWVPGAGQYRSYVFGSGASLFSAFVAPGRGWILAVTRISRATNLSTLFVNGVTGGNYNIATLGSMVDAGPIVFTNFYGTTALRVARFMSWHGVGKAAICDAAWNQRLAASVLGALPVMGESGAYARASMRTYYPVGPSGRVGIIDVNVTPAGNAEGLGSDEQIVSVSSQNMAIPAAPAAAYLASHIAPGTDAGIVASVVNDSANLGDAMEWGPFVVRLQNPTGGTLYQRLNNVIGGAPADSWVSIRARVVAGPIRMGWQTAAGAYTNVCNVATGYVRSSGSGLPGAATDRQCLELPAAADVYVIAYCDGTGLAGRVPDEVPSLAAFGVSSTVVMGALTTTSTPVSLEGSVEVLITPRGWGGAGAGTPGFLYLTGGGGAVLYVTGGTWRAAIDATTVLDSGVAPVDGVQHRVRLRWKTGVGMSIEVRDGATGALLARVDAAYDGSLAAAGTWQLANNGGPASVQLVRAERNGGS